MRITYDKSVDAAYIYFSEDTKEIIVSETYNLNKTLEFKGMVNLDLDKDGIILGIEVLNASAQLSKNLLSNAEITG